MKDPSVAVEFDADNFRRFLKGVDYADATVNRRSGVAKTVTEGEVPQVPVAT